MKLTILTTVTNPIERQDKWSEALANYYDFADEIVVVNGGNNSIFNDLPFIRGLPKFKEVMLPWPYEWNWVEYPRHLNEGLKHCTGDWIIRLDIDQLIHEDDFQAIREKLAKCPKECEAATFQKMSFTYNSKYYQKGSTTIAFKNLPGIVLGRDINTHTDLCFPIRETGKEYVYATDSVADKELIYQLPIGKQLLTFKTGIKYWNYDYFFKTEEFTKKEFWRASRAWNRYYKNWNFGSDEEKSFEIFLKMLKARYKDSPYTASALIIHPKHIQQAILDLKPEQFGATGWGLLNGR